MVNKLFAGNPTGTKNSTQNVWQISRVQGICLWEGTSNDSLFHTALSQAPSACRTISPERSLSGREGLLNGSECLGYALRRGSLPDHCDHFISLLALKQVCQMRRQLRLHSNT